MEGLGREQRAAKKTKQTLGRDLRASLPQLRVVQLRDGEERERAYRGIALAGAR